MTNLSAAPTQAPPRQHGDEAQLFSDLNDRLFHSVRHAVRACDALIEDACSFAWTQLLRRQPDREHIFAWLRTTAVREALTLSGRERRTRSLDDIVTIDGDGYALADTIPAIRLDLQLEARDALRTASTLRPLHRRTFARHVAGLSYAEIAAENQQTLRQIDRHLRRSRAALDSGRGEDAPAAA